MNKYIKSKRAISYILILICSFLCSIAFGIFFSNYFAAENVAYEKLENKKIFDNIGQHVNVYPNKDTLIYDYSIIDNEFTANSDDPMIINSFDKNEIIENVNIVFLEPIENNLEIKIYYSDLSLNFKEENSIQYNAIKGEKEVNIKIPRKEYSDIRIDIGNKKGDKFKLSSIKLFPYFNIQLSGYDLNGKTFLVTNNDPQIKFVLDKERVGTIKVDFSNPIPQELDIFIYYARENETLTNENHIEYKVNKGKKSIYIKIPEQIYSIIRVDIGMSEQELFELSKITLFPNTLYIYDIVGILNIFMYFIVFLIIFIAIFNKITFKFLYRIFNYFCIALIIALLFYIKTELFNIVQFNLLSGIWSIFIIHLIVFSVLCEFEIAFNLFKEKNFYEANS